MTRTELEHSWLPAVNFGERRDGKTPDILLLHYTGMESAKKACEWLASAQSKVSCHYLIDEEGAITQLVDEEMRAWHAGEASWKGERDINSRSIGIEIHNRGHEQCYSEFSDPQMTAVAALSRDIVDRHGIASERVLAHSDVSPGRKLDPGEKFDWRRLHRDGIGHWVEPVPITGGSFLQRGDEGEPVAALQGLLAAYGYGIEVDGVFDADTVAVVEAFQRHFRTSQVDGIADQSTIATLKALIDALPNSPIS